MTTHRRYYFNPPGEWTQGGHSRILEKLEQACEHFWWFRDPEVQGEPFGRLSFSFTASGRDQWWCHKRAMTLAIDCFYAIGFKEPVVPVPAWEPLAPHTQRGRYRKPVPASGPPHPGD
jgi:hypothetical protein